MRKQKLSPKASKDKAVRDKKIAMTPARREKKAENQRIGQKPDSDLHHPGNGEKPVRVSISQNRGNFGNGTKNEGPNMMGQTWLNRKINGPSAIGEGDKKKGGVKPYVTHDRDDPRIQAHSDSLDAHLITEGFHEIEFASDTGYTSIVPANTPSLTTTGSDYDYYASQTKMKPSRIVSTNYKTRRDFPLYDKPKQKVILQSLEKMPILKGSIKSKSASELKRSNRKSTSRKFTTSLNNPNPIKNSMAYKNYGEVNYGNGTGNRVVNKAEFEAHKKLFKK
jgi:hypothetical protein